MEISGAFYKLCESYIQCIKLISVKWTSWELIHCCLESNSNFLLLEYIWIIFTLSIHNNYYVTLCVCVCAYNVCVQACTKDFYIVGGGGGGGGGEGLWGKGGGGD